MAADPLPRPSARGRGSGVHPTWGDAKSPPHRSRAQVAQAPGFGSSCCQPRRAGGTGQVALVIEPQCPSVARLCASLRKYVAGQTVDYSTLRLKERPAHRQEHGVHRGLFGGIDTDETPVPYIVGN